ncbi:Piwi-domain-containing protein [Clavulina sp. PMI_390]|nr:Piwi-domain-containing protein [Clavulina sp. PMI_390]
MPPKAVAVNQPLGPNVQAIGVRRPGFGKAGRPSKIKSNHFLAEIPQDIIHHYDVVILPSDKILPPALNLEIIMALQTRVAPADFDPPAVYDGRKNIFAPRELPFGDSGMKEFEVSLGDGKPRADGKPPKVYKVRLNKVAEINPETLHRFLAGTQSHDNSVLTAITALNVIIRMEPTLKWPFNVRSFFTDQETKDIGMGMILWRGYFQSARPSLGKMLINIDISTGIMFKGGNLIDIALDFFNKQGNPQMLAPKRGFPDRERLRLQRFITGLRINTPGSKAPRPIKKISTQGAADMRFAINGGGTKTVAAYFLETANIRLKFPDLPCVEVGAGALIPFELCTVPVGQIMRRQVPPEKTKEVLEFATRKPDDRLASIRRGVEVLSYGQSPYVRAFGMSIDASRGPLELDARVLPAPVLRYGGTGKDTTIQPKDGAWNMINKKFYSPCTIRNWGVMVFERRQRFGDQAVAEMIQGLGRSCHETGIRGLPPDPIVEWGNGQGDIIAQLKGLGQAVNRKGGAFPDLLVVILPEGSTDIYIAVKHFGDIVTGVATQCLKSTKCYRAKPQYYANVCLKINVKLGGINTIPDPRSVPFLTDPVQPTVVMGADVIHPAPGSEGRPSFTSLVANVDSDTAKYVAATRVQTSRQEMIDDLQVMAINLLKKYTGYRQMVEKKSNPAPRRIIFYRDGVSEGQFKTVLDTEVPLLKEACRACGFNPIPKITVIVVGKRHHVRFFPRPNEGDRSGNCPAGTVVDTSVTNPAEFDFYLQSHGGLLGTSRPAHYNVLLDENNFSPDGIQQLSFALCHVYARSTRSVSIPAPVYYADIVCSRAKNHYDPNASGMYRFSDDMSQFSGGRPQASLDDFRSGFKPLHPTTERLMYFS